MTASTSWRSPGAILDAQPAQAAYAVSRISLLLGAASPMTPLRRERGRLRFQEVEEGLGQRRAGAVAMGDEVERPRDFQIRHLHAVQHSRAALVLDRPLGDERDADAGPYRLPDSLRGYHLPDHAERGEVAAAFGQRARRAPGR